MKFSKLFLLGLFVFSLFSFVGAHVGEDDYSHHGMMDGVWGMNSFYSLGIFMWIFLLLVIVILVLIIILLTKRVESGNKKRK